MWSSTMLICSSLTRSVSLLPSTFPPAALAQLIKNQTVDPVSDPLQNMAMPIAAIETLASLISASSVSTVQELFSLLEGAAEELKKASFNPISLASGTQLLLRFLTIQRLSPDQSFDEFKAELVDRASEFVEGSGRCRDIIAAHVTTFVKDDSVSTTPETLT